MSVSLLTEFLVLAALMAAGWLHFHKRCSGGKLLCGGVLLILFALLASSAAGRVPPLRDEVTLTAPGEKNDMALADEVFLLGYTMDGKEYSSGDNIEVLGEGKWSWFVDTYGWRNETDPRQPEGTTRSVTLGIPVGRDRALNFEGNIYHGFVEISFGGQTWSVDTYSNEESNTVVAVPIEDSDASDLAWNEFRVLLVYAAALLALCAASWLIWKLAHRYRAALCKNYDVLIYILLSLFMLAAMRYYHQFNDMVWGDDWGGFSFMAMPLNKVVLANLMLWDLTPPLFNIIAWTISKVFCLPHTVSALFLIPQSFLCMTVVVMGLLGRKLTGKKWCGILAAELTATSASLILSTGYEFRAYSLFLLCSALTLLAYMTQLKETHFSAKRSVLYAICLTVLTQAHYLGLAILGMLFLSDLMLVARKRKGIRSLFAYVLPVGLLAVWVIAVISAGPSMPKLVPVSWGMKQLLELAQYLAGGNLWVLGLFGAAVAWIIVNLKDFWDKANAEEQAESWRYHMVLLMMACIVAMIVAVEVAMIFLGLSFDKYRYMVALSPMVLLLIVFFGENALCFLTQHDPIGRKQKAFLCTAALILLFGGMNQEILSDMGVKDTRYVPEQNNSRMAYMSIIDYLESQYDIHYATTGVFATTPETFKYFINGGRYSDVNIENILSEDKVDQYDTVYCVYYDWIPINHMEEYEVISNNYTLVENNESLLIAKYVRNY